MRFALLVGHTASSQGAKAYTGETEFSFNSRVARCMHTSLLALQHEARIFYRTDHKASFDLIAAEYNLYKPDVSIELHFNSFNSKAYGCEALIYEKSRNLEGVSRLADYVTDVIAEYYGMRERGTVIVNGETHDGVLILADESRGARNLKTLETKTKVPFIFLIEPCFANIKTKESEKIIGDPNKYAKVLATALHTYFLNESALIF